MQCEIDHESQKCCTTMALQVRPRCRSNGSSFVYEIDHDNKSTMTHDEYKISIGVGFLIFLFKVWKTMGTKQGAGDETVCHETLENNLQY